VPDLQLTQDIKYMIGKDEKPVMETHICGFDCSLDSKGKWSFLKKSDSPRSFVKKNPKYKEKPMFKLNETIEQAAQHNYSGYMKTMSKELILQLNKYKK